VKLTHIDQSSKESRDRVDQLIKAYNDSPNYAKVKAVQPTKEAPKNTTDSAETHAQSTLTQIKLLSKRALVDTAREPLK
jgi:hypothetical protein